MEHKIKLSIGPLEVELTGSEEFINKYEEKFQLVMKVQQLGNEELLKNVPRETTQSQNVREGNLPRTNNYEYVFDLNGEKTKLTLRQIPGNNTAEKQVNVACLYIYGEGIRSKDPTILVPIKEIREQCKHYACMNTNFSTNLQNEKRMFTIQGKKGSRSKQIKLNKPGEAKARELATELNHGLSASNT